MCGSSGDVPKPHDPGQTAEIQNKYNLGAGNATLAANAMNQYTPFGTLTYEPTTGPDGVTRYTARQTLDPKNQALLDSLYGTKGLAGQGATNVLQGAYSGAPDVVGTSNSITEKMMAGQMGFLNPFFNQQTENMDNQLRNQGIMPGTPAYDRQMNSLRQSQGQTVSGAIAQFEPQAFQQAMASYNLPADTAAKLAALGGPMGISLRDNTPTTNFQAANYTGAVASADEAAQQAYAAQQAAQAAEIAGIAGAVGKIGGAAIMASDKRVKTDIALVGELFDGTPVYRFRYLAGGPVQIGVMAQDIEKTNPGAVHEIDGVKYVDYGKATQMAAEVIHGQS